MVVTDGLHRLTGALTPDVRGDYLPAGIEAGKTYYQLIGNGWYLWWNPVGVWVLNATVGVPGGVTWINNTADVEGDYFPGGGASGTGTVTEI